VTTFKGEQSQSKVHEAVLFFDGEQARIELLHTSAFNLKKAEGAAVPPTPEFVRIMDGLALFL